MSAARTAKKNVPAKRAGKGARPAVLAVEVVRGREGFHAAARNQSAFGHSTSYAVMKLAKLLGYSAGADVRYVRTDGEAQHFQIVEVSP